MPVRQPFPAPPPSFVDKKRRILTQLAVPVGEYKDASPKGSVDVGIRDLIDEINAVEGLVTTSSCAGRVCVFVEGRKALPTPLRGSEGDANHEDGGTIKNSTIARAGGKGGGGTWLFVSHDPVGDENELEGLITASAESPGDVEETEMRRLIHFKFEPMILHVLAASFDHAQLLLRCGLQAGFRESGAINLTSSTSSIPNPALQAALVTPMVAIRSTGLAFESLLGYQQANQRNWLATREYRAHLISIANERFAENTVRIERFRDALREGLLVQDRGGLGNSSVQDGTEWEDATLRRARKKAEGLRRKAELMAAAGLTRNGSKVDAMTTDEARWDDLQFPST